MEKGTAVGSGEEGRKDRLMRWEDEKGSAEPQVPHPLGLS